MAVVVAGAALQCGGDYIIIIIIILVLRLLARFSCRTCVCHQVINITAHFFTGKPGRHEKEKKISVNLYANCECVKFENK